jgi:hypothetical protein
VVYDRRRLVKTKRTLVGSLIVAGALGTVANAADRNIQLNEDSLRFAAGLIEQGRFVADKNGNWREHRPSVAQENAFIRVHGIGEYAKWHLGMNLSHGEKSKARHKFPLGDFHAVHRCALIAIRSRAHEYGYFEIENAAAKLQRALESRARTVQSTREFPLCYSTP